MDITDAGQCFNRSRSGSDVWGLCFVGMGTEDRVFILIF